MFINQYRLDQIYEKQKTITEEIINPLSPLSYTKEAAGGLITFARHGQALLISSMVLAGISGPITIAGTAVMEMTERVGNSGNYMMTDETVMGCRTALFPSYLAQRGTYEDWCKGDLGNTARIAARHVDERLEAYVKPDNDLAMEKN